MPEPPLVRRRSSLKSTRPCGDAATAVDAFDRWTTTRVVGSVKAATFSMASST
jgi:hypothetical protein